MAWARVSLAARSRRCNWKLNRAALTFDLLQQRQHRIDMRASGLKVFVLAQCPFHQGIQLRVTVQLPPTRRQRFGGFQG